jgi:hypothetical protein
MVSDTTDTVRARQRALVAGRPPAERLLRAFALSAFVREVAWAGAQRAVGERGPDAVRQRFLTQLYGHDMPDALRALIARL